MNILYILNITHEIGYEQAASIYPVANGRKYQRVRVQLFRDVLKR
jgi:hypothetical protein